MISRQRSTKDFSYRRSQLALVGLFSGTFFTGVIVSPRDCRADTDVIAFLNSALAQKHIMVNRIRTVSQPKTVCYMTSAPHPHRDCAVTTENVNQTYPDQARARSQILTSIGPLKFDNAKAINLPATAKIQRITYDNCGEDPFTTGYTLTVTGTSGHSVTKSQSLSFTTGVSVSNQVSASIDGFGGSTSMNMNFSMTLSDTTTHTETETSSESRVWPISITVAQGHAGYLELLVFQQTIQVPFSSMVVVDGDLEDNSSGYTKASQLLNENERTLPFSGTITSTGLSNSFTGEFKPDVPLSCDDPSLKGKSTSNPASFTFPASSIPATFAKNFGGLKENLTNRLAEIIKIPAAVGNPTALQNGPSMGPADGTSYQVMSSTEVTIMDPACGFNDIGVPNAAVHKSEARHYSTFSNGALVSQWDETVDSFLRCSPG